MKTLTKILICLLVFTLGTSSSNPRGQNKKEVPKLYNYVLNLDKSKLCFKDKQMLHSLDSLEKRYVKLVKLKKEVLSLKDSTKQ